MATVIHLPRDDGPLDALAKAIGTGMGNAIKEQKKKAEDEERRQLLLEAFELANDPNPTPQSKMEVAKRVTKVTDNPNTASLLMQRMFPENRSADLNKVAVQTEAYKRSGPGGPIGTATKTVVTQKELNEADGDLETALNKKGLTGFKPEKDSSENLTENEARVKDVIAANKLKDNPANRARISEFVVQGEDAINIAIKQNFGKSLGEGPLDFSLTSDADKARAQIARVMFERMVLVEGKSITQAASDSIDLARRSIPKSSEPGKDLMKFDEQGILRDVDENDNIVKEKKNLTSSEANLLNDMNALEASNKVEIGKVGDAVVVLSRPLAKKFLDPDIAKDLSTEDFEAILAELTTQLGSEKNALDFIENLGL